MLLIEYAHEADEPECRFWRGLNEERREYLGLDNLLVASKLDDRLDRARAWRAGNKPIGERASTLIGGVVVSGAVMPRRGAR